MRTQIALRLDDNLVDEAKRRAARENRSLANYIEGILAETFIADREETPIISLVDNDFEGAVVVDKDGNIDPEETGRLHHLLAVARKG